MGLLAVLFALKHNRDVLVSDTTKHMLRLPDSITSWKLFLRGNTLSVLLAYMVRHSLAYIIIIDGVHFRLMIEGLIIGAKKKHLFDLMERIEEQELKHVEEARTADRYTPEREAQPLDGFTFLSSSKRRYKTTTPRLARKDDDKAIESVVQDDESDDFQECCYD
jgi:hypothetical protein